MHTVRVAAVKVRYIHRNALAKICLKAVHAHVQKCFQLVCVPCARIRVCKIHNTHAGLPQICLPDAFAVAAFQQIAVFDTLFEKRRSLSNIRIDPYAYFKAAGFIPRQHFPHIREHPVIPFKIAPVEFFHPETVKMKNAQRNISLRHPFNESACRPLIIVGRK